MRHSFPRASLLFALFGGSLLGCQALSGRPPRPQDPLLACKQPLQSTPATAAPVALAHAEPALPPLPEIAFVYPPSPIPQTAGTALAQRPPEPGRLPLLEESPAVPGTLASRRNTSGLLEALPVSRRKVPGLYGHAPDYSWLQGILEDPPSGTRILRYLPAPQEDQADGRVFLEDDGRLAQVRPADILLVEGELVPGHAVRQTSETLSHYRIRSLWLVQRGD